MPSTVVLVRWADGWAERESSSGVSTYGRSEALLGLGALGSLAEVYRVSDATLDEFASDRLEAIAGFAPVSDSEAPYLAFRPGDLVIHPTKDLSPITARCMSITVGEDEDGNAQLEPSFGTIVIDERTRVFQALKKMANGTIGGRSKVAQPVLPLAIPHALPQQAGACVNYQETFLEDLTVDPCDTSAYQYNGLLEVGNNHWIGVSSGGPPPWEYRRNGNPRISGGAFRAYTGYCVVSGAPVGASALGNSNWIVGNGTGGGGMSPNWQIRTVNDAASSLTDAFLEVAIASFVTQSMPRMISLELFYGGATPVSTYNFWYRTDGAGVWSAAIQRGSATVPMIDSFTAGYVKASATGLPALAAGDTLRIDTDGTTVRAWRNGALLLSTPVAGAVPDGRDAFVLLGADGQFTSHANAEFSNIADGDLALSGIAWGTVCS